MHDTMIRNPVNVPFDAILALLQRMHTDGLLTDVELYKPAIRVIQLLQHSPSTKARAKQMLAELRNTTQSAA